ncbi:MAG: hypothetical protein CMK09_09000 [Ponticaulis sp.]|nr:hypothetical protein [Ponticaulis sp.]
MIKGNILHILFEDPLIACVRLDAKTAPTLDWLARRANGANFHVCLMPSWSLRKTLGRRYGEIEPSLKAHPNMTCVMLAQEPNDEILIREIGMEPVLCNHNCFLDEAVMYPEPGREKRFDAIYVGRYNPFKRHELAWDVPNIAVVTAKFGVQPDIAADLQKGYRSLAWSNFDPDTGVTLQSVEEVRGLLSEAYCGLALSAEEGAMYAAGEYALAGLPIVTTPSIGGRDQFFLPEWVKTVQPDPAEISAAVEAFKQAPPSPEMIRSRTLDLMRPHRENLIGWLERILQHPLRERARPTGWLPEFTHRMQVWHNFT